MMQNELMKKKQKEWFSFFEPSTKTSATANNLLGMDFRNLMLDFMSERSNMMNPKMWEWLYLILNSNNKNEKIEYTNMGGKYGLE